MTTFNVLRMSEPETLVLDPASNLPMVFADGKAAADFAKLLTEGTGERHVPKRVLDAAWRERELTRFRDGTYGKLPWRWTYWYEGSSISADHFAHPSVKKPGLLAYTESPDKGAADIQTPIKPGAYLKKFFGDHLCDDDIKHWSSEFTKLYAPVTVKFADDADGIEHVYVNGPSSCMAGPASKFASPIHPARVYAAGDLAVAYLECEEGDITARAMCWPAKKIYGRIYGDECRLSAELERQGYRSGSLEGARMLREETDNGQLVVPYVDGCYRATDDGEYLRIRSGGEVNCETTNGLSGHRARCERCDEGYDPEDDEAGFVEDCDQHWCGHCYQNHTFFCERTERTCSGDSVEMANGQTWSEYAFDRYGATCDESGEHYPADECITLDDGTVWHQDHFASHGFTCASCGSNRSIDDPCTDCEGERLAIAGRDESPDQIEMMELV